MAIKVPEIKEIVPSVLSNLLNWGTDSADAVVFTTGFAKYNSENFRR
jgi:hypothetical protein